ncbi:Predicted amidohydrolase [Micrococcales bacterium KH10]|nr:Predicted amidohydrolase [Micrococcales bacterium KH10]
MRTTLGQVAAATDRVANIEVLRNAAQHAAARKSDLLILPEYASAYDKRGVGIDLAEPPEGPYVQAMREMAARHQIWIIAGVVIADPTGDERSLAAAKARNVVVAVAPDGTVADAYDKVHLYDAFGARESDRLKAGSPHDPAVVIAIGGVKVGIMTCYDLRFPESARRLVDAGAQVIVVPAAWAQGDLKIEQWELLVRARALENVCVVVAVGMSGAGVIGHSVVAAPDGMPVLSMGDEPEFRTVDIDVDLVEQARRINPSLTNRRYRVVPAATDAQV